MFPKKDNSPIGSRTPSVRLPNPTRRSVATWLKDLPEADTAYAFDALAALLESFNQQAGLSPALRFELAELIRPAALVMARRAETHFLDSSLPYPDDAASLLKKGLWLHYQLQLAYALPYLKPPSPGSAAQGGGPLGQALYRAFQQAGLVLLWTTQLYGQPDERYWLLLYRLYRVAEAQHLLDAEFEESGEPESCWAVEGMFKRCLLFYLANTRRFRQREMAQLYALLGELGGTAYLGCNVAHNGEPAEFAINLASGSPPLRAQVLIDSDVSGLRFLCTHTLARTLMAAGGTAKPELDKSILLRIARSLGAEDRRRSKRWPESDLCRYLIGLPGVVAALSEPSADDTPLSPEIQAGPVANAVPGHSSAKPAGRPPWKAASRSQNPGALVPSGERQSSKSTDAATDSASVIEIQGRMINSGPRGYCIVWPASAAARTKVGELIGIRSGTGLFIGVIRWLECSRGGWRFGVELLTPSARVAEFRRKIYGPKERALLLPMEPALRSGPEILSAPGAFRTGDLLKLNVDGIAIYYGIREVLEATPSFLRLSLFVPEQRAEPS